MDDLRTLLFNPAAARRLVHDRRPAVPPNGRAVVADVVSDRVWRDVVELLRWASGAAHAVPALRAGAWWRLAAGCADLLRRLPALADELAEHWDAGTAEDIVDPGAEVPGAERVQAVARRLATELVGAGPLDLQRLAVLVDALGAAAVAALADGCRR